MADNYDFQIENLKFRAATSDRFPYARATAPFRKEQFDSAPTVGDQSLSGWWTRGQLSFHKGAGIKYYEVLEGEEVLSRFRSSQNVIVREPGKVTLAPGAPLYNTSTLKKGTSVTLGATGEIAGVTTSDEGVILNGTTTTPLTTSMADASVYDVTFGNFKTFFATSKGVDVLPSSGSTLTSAWAQIAAGDIYGFPASVWFAKGRLFTVTASGKWFAKATDETGTLADADAFWVSGINPTERLASWEWRLADSPGPLYLAAGPDVYRVSVDASSGSIPTLGAGVTAMTLPSGEYVVEMQYGLGQLVLLTNKGIRVALVGDNGDLVYGPLIVKGVGIRSNGIVIQGSVAYIGLYVEDSNDVPRYGVVCLDLATPLSDLVYAWTLEYPHPDNGLVRVCSANGKRWYLHLSGGVYQAEPSTKALASTGSLTTGLHRFGTLEGKHFAGVKVRAAGAGGTIQVYLVEQSGAEVLLGTVNVAESDGADISLVTSAPAEAIGLRFALNCSTTDSTIGPELLGYQIKALPSPVRQRLIKWPLLITDTYRDRYGVARGARDGAWDAWSALETLEESDALVSFTDHRTGETGNAYIEELELQTETPSKGASTGFGGVGYLTLRKV